jgi:hypothetical protein
MGLIIWTALVEVTLLEAGVGETPWLPATSKKVDSITTAWMVEAMKFMKDKGIYMMHNVIFTTNSAHDQFLNSILRHQPPN